MKLGKHLNVRPYSQKQSLLFPPNLLDFIEQDDLCMVVDDVVNILDLSCLYHKLPQDGPPSYHPKMMLKVLFYSYASGIFSSREIDKALGENIALIYLAAWQRPNFRTINRFRHDNLNELDNLFVQIVRLCQELKMVKLGHISIDGSKFKANAADRQSYDQSRVEKEMKRLLEKAAAIDQEENDLYGSDNRGDELPEDAKDHSQRVEKLKQLKQKLDQQDKEKVNATDPDAAFMRTGNGIKTSYNTQAAVDETSQVVVAAGVVNDSNDQDQLLTMVKQTEQNTQKSVSTLSADAGYSSVENLEKLEGEGYKHIDAYIPDATYQGRSRGKKSSPFDKSQFTYDESADRYVCPAGKVLPFWHNKQDKCAAYRVYRCYDCQDCPHFGECTKSKKGRTIWRMVNDKRIQAMRSKLDSEAGKAIYNKRKHIVEPVFGHMKTVIGFTSFHLRGLEKVNGEFKLVAIVHNLKKISKWGYKKRFGLTPMAVNT